MPTDMAQQFPSREDGVCVSRPSSNCCRWRLGRRGGRQHCPRARLQHHPPRQVVFLRRQLDEGNQQDLEMPFVWQVFRRFLSAESKKQNSQKYGNLCVTSMKLVQVVFLRHFAVEKVMT